MILQTKWKITWVNYFVLSCLMKFFFFSHTETCGTITATQRSLLEQNTRAERVWGITLSGAASYTQAQTGWSYRVNSSSYGNTVGLVAVNVVVVKEKVSHRHFFYCCVSFQGEMWQMMTTVMLSLPKSYCC